MYKKKFYIQPQSWYQSTKLHHLSNNKETFNNFKNNDFENISTLLYQFENNNEISICESRWDQVKILKGRDPNVLSAFSQIFLH